MPINTVRVVAEYLQSENFGFLGFQVLLHADGKYRAWKWEGARPGFWDGSVDLNVWGATTSWVPAYPDEFVVEVAARKFAGEFLARLGPWRRAYTGPLTLDHTAVPAAPPAPPAPPPPVQAPAAPVKRDPLAALYDTPLEDFVRQRAAKVEGQRLGKREVRSMLGALDDVLGAESSEAPRVKIPAYLPAVPTNGRLWARDLGPRKYTYHDKNKKLIEATADATAWHSASIVVFLDGYRLVIHAGSGGPSEVSERAWKNGTRFTRRELGATDYATQAAAREALATYAPRGSDWVELK